MSIHSKLNYHSLFLKIHFHILLMYALVFNVYFTVNFVHFCSSLCKYYMFNPPHMATQIASLAVLQIGISCTSKQCPSVSKHFQQVLFSLSLSNCFTHTHKSGINIIATTFLILFLWKIKFSDMYTHKSCNVSVFASSWTSFLNCPGLEFTVWPWFLG
jgi:hypothetical protein